MDAPSGDAVFNSTFCGGVQRHCPRNHFGKLVRARRADYLVRTWPLPRCDQRDRDESRARRRRVGPGGVHRGIERRSQRAVSASGFQSARWAGLPTARVPRLLPARTDVTSRSIRKRRIWSLRARREIFSYATPAWAPQHCSPQTWAVDLAADGSAPNALAGDHVALSANGRFVAFVSSASNLVPAALREAGSGGMPADSHVFVRDMCVGSDAPASCKPQTNVAFGRRKGQFGSRAFRRRSAATADSSPSFRGTETSRRAVPKAPRRFSCAIPARADRRQSDASRRPFAFRWTARIRRAGPAERSLRFPSDGRYIAFEGWSPRFAAGDGSLRTRIFLRDTCLGAGRSRGMHTSDDRHFDFAKWLAARRHEHVPGDQRAWALCRICDAGCGRWRIVGRIRCAAAIALARYVPWANRGRELRSFHDRNFRWQRRDSGLSECIFTVDQRVGPLHHFCRRRVGDFEQWRGAARGLRLRSRHLLWRGGELRGAHELGRCSRRGCRRERVARRLQIQLRAALVRRPLRRVFLALLCRRRHPPVGLATST